MPDVPVVFFPEGWLPLRSKLSYNVDIWLQFSSISAGQRRGTEDQNVSSGRTSLGASFETVEDEVIRASAEDDTRAEKFLRHTRPLAFEIMKDIHG